MRRYKNGTTTFDGDDIDAALGLVPAPLREGMPVIVRKPSGHRRHLALTPASPRTICGVDSGLDDDTTRRYDLDDDRFARRAFPCRACRKLAPIHGFEFVP